MQIPEEHDLESQIRKEREWRFLRNSRVRRQAQQLIQRGEAGPAGEAGGPWGTSPSPHSLGFPPPRVRLLHLTFQRGSGPPQARVQARVWLWLRSPCVPCTGITRLDDQIFLNRNPGVPSVVKFHPFTPCVAVADKDSIW